ncbi:helix-turn-helix transcriptional regulator [Duganella zoogloeoides]|uniref:Helix-turn-helix transcriptional regulator n=1 Tax=Duganella zoogloeoides TaxID=75659 RepID=A0ABZ0XZV5_9BURK|nr:helix-turn-helix transcriptional regulator [Duganella zoogloeoides]WQH04706.1 helix-turn-helix transcriptional regulator [Duganella zoogloeoides]
MPKPPTISISQLGQDATTLEVQLKDARLRRHLSAETVASRAGISRHTLSRIKLGSSSVTMGNCFHLFAVLGLEKDIHDVARDNIVGRRLQDAGCGMVAAAPGAEANRCLNRRKVKLTSVDKIC